MIREQRIASMLLALRLFGSLDTNVYYFEWEVMKILVDRGYAEVIDGKLVLRRKKCE